MRLQTIVRSGRAGLEGLHGEDDGSTFPESAGHRVDHLVQRAYRDDRFKLIEYRVNGAHRTQLFDLRHDPSETKNLSSDPAHAQTLATLRRKLRETQLAAGDPQAAPVR